MIKRTFLLLALVMLSGCAVQNNQRTTEEFAQHLVNCGIAVKGVRGLQPDPLRANEAIEIKIDDNTIAVYKYNQDTEVQRERLKRFKEEGRAYLIGIPFPIEIQGSFVVLGLEKHPRKKELIEAIRRFE